LKEAVRRKLAFMDDLNRYYIHFDTYTETR